MPIKFYTPICVLFVLFWFFHSERKLKKNFNQNLELPRKHFQANIYFHRMIPYRKGIISSNFFNFWSIYPFKSQKKMLSYSIPLEQKLPSWDTPFSFYFHPRTRACNPFQDQPQNGIARDNVTTRPFSPRFQFQVASSFLSSFLFSLSLSLSALPTNRPSPTLKGRDEKGMEKRWEGKDERKR